MNTKKISQTIALVLCAMLLLFATSCANTNTPTNGSLLEGVDNPEKVVIYFFWGDGCPHCMTQKPFMEELEKKYDFVEVKSFETWKNPQNAKFFQEVAKAYGTSAQGVPTTFIGDESWVGFATYMGAEMEQYILSCQENNCPNPGDKLSN